jgi:hypothetical protein
MADAEFWLDVDGTDDLTRVVAALGEIAKYIPKDIDDKIEDVAVQLAEKAGRKVQAVRMRTPGNERSTGLRRRIARGIGVHPFIEGGYRITTSMPDSDEAIIPRGFDSPAKGFRHPVFGNKQNWVSQTPADGWFRETVDDAAHILPDKLEDILEFAAEWVDDAT